MNDKIKNLLAYLGIFLLLGLLGIVTYYKYFEKEILPETEKQPTTNQKLNTKDNIRSIKNLEDLVTNDFSLTDLELKFDDENQVITIIGNINNLTEKEKDYKILSSIYNKDKYQIHSKQISIDTKIQPDDTIPFFINYYYDELDTDKNEVKYYELKIKE